MYELIKLSENDYYLDCPSKIGIVKINSTEVVAIDSGNNKDAGKKLLKVLNENGWTLKAVFNTHSHADHIGGNKLLKDRTNCNLYAYGLESTVASNTIFEPISLYGGFPFDDLRHKFLMADNSDVLPLTDEVLPEGMKILPLPGHSFQMVGFITKDNNVFIADSVLSENTLDKYGIGFLFDVAAGIETLNMLKTLKAEHFIPSHSDVCTDITRLADCNLASIQKISNKILSLLQTPCDTETVIKNMFDSFEIFVNAEQYVLVGSTVRSYLAMLKNEGKITYEFTDNKLLWKAV